MPYTPPEHAPINLVNNPRQFSVQKSPSSISSNSLPQMFTLEEIEKKAHEIATPIEKGVISNVFFRLRKRLSGE